MTSAQEAGRSRWVLAAVSMALFCVQIDYFAMNLALPRMASELNSTAADLQWVISVYMLALGAFMVPAGRIGDIFGRRRALLAGIALFGVASAACALAPSATLVIVFRAVQGLGAALIFPVSVSVLTNAFPAVRASHAIGLAYGIAGLGNAAGPLIGGLLTETVGWRWIFWLNVPLTLVSLAIGAWSIKESSDESVPRRIDTAGLALITFGIGLFTLTFDRAPHWGWTSAWTAAAFAGSLVALAVFVVVENRVRWPLVDLSLAQDPRFTILVVAGAVANIAYGVTILLSTLYLQQVRELDPMMAGLAFLARRQVRRWAARCRAGSPPAAHPLSSWAPRVWPPRWRSRCSRAADDWVIYLSALTVCGFTLGLVYAFTTVATQAVVRPERAGEAAGVTLTALVTLAGVGSRGVRDGAGNACAHWDVDRPRHRSHHHRAGGGAAASWGCGARGRATLGYGVGVTVTRRGVT